MAKNHAAKKAAKAAKRKAVVSARRRDDRIATSVAGQMRAAVNLPIAQCLVSDGLFENGMGAVLLARGVPMGRQYIAIFMLDTYALGVKDVNLMMPDWREAKDIIDYLQDADPMSPIDPGEARKLLDDLIGWAASSGFEPHADWTKGAVLFGTIAATATNYNSRFGRDGKVIYIPGPSETAGQVRRRMAIIEEHQGPEALQVTLDAITEAMIEDGSITEEDLAEAEEMLRAEGLLDDDDDAIEGEAQELPPDRPA